jgi:hypothetical protein
VVFNGYTNELRLFRLTVEGYREESWLNNRFWFPEIKLGLGLWQGVYSLEDRLWLRWYEATGNWILTPLERVQPNQLRAAQHRAVLELHRAELAKHRAAQLAAKLAKLRVLGIDLDLLH